MQRTLQVRNYVIGAVSAFVLTGVLAAIAGSNLRSNAAPWMQFTAFMLIVALFAFPGVQVCQAIAKAKAAEMDGNLVEARAFAYHARESLLRIFGIGGFAVCLACTVIFFTTADFAVQRTFLDWEHISESFSYILQALWINVAIAIVAQVFSMVFGLILAIARLLPGRSLAPIRVLAIAYIDIFRGLPAIVVIYLICFGLPITRIPFVSEGPPVVYAIVALTITFSAYNAELFRAGIEGVNESQTSAALSLGMTPTAVMRLVVLPQAMRNITAPVLSLFIALQKDTALVNVVGIIDAFTQAKIFAAQQFNLSAISVVCLLFIVLTIPQTRFVDALLARSDRRISRNSTVD